MLSAYRLIGQRYAANTQEIHFLLITIDVYRATVSFNCSTVIILDLECFDDAPEFLGGGNI